MSRSALEPDAMPDWEAAVSALDRIPGLPESEQAAAIEELLRFPYLGIRERARRLAAALLPEDVLVGYIRHEADDVLRCAGLETLKLRGADSVELAIRLSADDDDEVVIQSVQLMDSFGDPCVLETLRGLLGHPNPNVVQAAIIAIGHLGNARSSSDLVPFLSADTWLQLAAIAALRDLRCPDAIESLCPLSTDLTVGPAVIEAIGCIGGEPAACALIGHWRLHGDAVDSCVLLGLLAHCLEGLPVDHERADSALRSDLIVCLDDEDPVLRVRAARCVLALGEECDPEGALQVLAEGAGDTEGSPLPACLKGRYDLLAQMLATPNVLRTWAILLGSAEPSRLPVSEFLVAITDFTTTVPIAETAQILASLEGIEVAASLLQLYQRVSDSDRGALSIALTPHEDDLRALAQRPEADPILCALIMSGLGDPSEIVVQSVTRLTPEARASVIPQLACRGDVIEALPWEAWLRDEPSPTSRLLARAAALAKSTALLPLLRKVFEESPTIDLVRALAVLGDSEIVPQLIGLLDQTESAMAAAIIDALGDLGGPQARTELRKRAAGIDQENVRFALRSLARCATEEDENLYRKFAEHSDWYVRLACAEVLGRFRRADNLAVLMKLCNDPVRIVAQKALALIDG